MRADPPSSGTNMPRHRYLSERQITSMMQARAIRTLDHFDGAIQVFALVAVILAVVTVVLIGLAQSLYVTPMLCLYSLSGIIFCYFVIKCIDCCQNAYAKKYNLDLQEDYYAVKCPPIKQRKTAREKFLNKLQEQ